jgi:hypothetical protein
MRYASVLPGGLVSTSALTRIALPVLLAGLLPFAGCGASQTQVDKLENRIATLEKRVRQLEGGGGRVPAKAKKRRRRGKARRGNAANDGGVGAIEVAGDAVKVALEQGDKVLAVPGKVPAGEYAILAAFAADEEMVKAGSLEVDADGSMLVDCRSKEMACAAKSLN